MFAVALFEFYGFTSTFAQVVQFGFAYTSATERLDTDDIWAVHGEYTLNTLIAHHASDREHLVDAASFAGNHGTSEYLNAFFVAFDDPAMHVDGVANLEMRQFVL